MKCDICTDEVKDTVVVIDPLMGEYIGKEELTLCESCYTVYIKQDFKQLISRIKKGKASVSTVIPTVKEEKPKKKSSSKELERKKAHYAANKEKILAYKKELYMKKKEGNLNATE